jgi:hypothetical protein
MNKEDFDKELRARLVGNYHPFLSNGHPLDAKIVFIGCNYSRPWDPEYLVQANPYGEPREILRMSKLINIRK